MSDIAANIKKLGKELPAGVRIVAVSKTKPVIDILEAYNSGQRVFGENRVQELLQKKVMLPSDIEWHLIGHLQTNKVKYVVPFISMIESVDTFRLLKVINDEAASIQRVIDCLLQIHIAREEAKFGFSMREVIEALESSELPGLKHLRIRGVMGMATFTDDRGLIRQEFRFLADCFRELKKRYFKEDQSFNELSMGMSGDYQIAVSEGSTIVRIGSVIFGERKMND